jgi:DNA repair exonuclease SbcCD ATPase subunit
VIPLRVSIKNFLCHHEQVFEFDGHRVWLLHGPNGVGKSTVFDAMLYALFGEHKRRTGADSSVEDLVRHGETSARVDFDFEYRNTRYRVWRVRPRKGAAKQGVSVFEGETPVPLPELNRVAEVDQWVKDLLGMDCEAFTSAALLRQGAAERLLDSDIEDRIGLYRGIIDVAPYQRLEEAVIEERRLANAEARSLAATLDTLRDVPESELAAAIEMSGQSIAEWERCRESERSSRGRLAASRVWDELNANAAKLRELLDAAKDRAGRVDELEAAVRRLKELRIVIPALERFDSATNRLHETRSRLEEATRDRGDAEIKCESLRTSVAVEKQRAEQSRDRKAELERDINGLDEQLRRLKEQIEKAESAAELHRSLDEARKKPFDSDLDEQFEQSVAAVAGSAEAKTILPSLEAVAKQRAAFRSAVDAENVARTGESTAAAERDRIQQELEAAEAEKGRAEQAANQASQKVAVCKHQLETANEALSKLDSLEGRAECSLCGSPLQPGHVEQERERLSTAARDAKSAWETAQTESKNATAATKEATTLSNVLTKKVKTAEAVRSQAVTQLQLAEQSVRTARAAFSGAISSLSAELVQRIGSIEAAQFPLESDLEHVRETSRQLTSRSKRHEELRDRISNRDETARTIAHLETAVAAVGAPADVSQAKADVKTGETRRGELQTERDAVEKTHAASEEAQARFESELRAAEQAAKQLEGRFGAAEAESGTAEREHAAARDALPAGSQELDRTQLQSEKDRLDRADVERDFAAVAEDRTLKADREARLLQTESEIESRVPPEARRPSSEVTREVAAAEKRTQDSERIRDESRKVVERLERERARRVEIERDLAVASRRHGLHHRLADLLGAEGIQTALVHQAEARIIDFANETLHRVSAGNLHLEHAPGEDRIAIRWRGQPVPGDNLSSGQRCRAAVSLALAVCRFAGGEARPLQSVIIDEAFANLDREGRMAMVEVIRDGTMAGGMLERIIVVSHHEDVAASFPVGYRLSHDGVRTVAVRVSEVESPEIE